jgi:hypothetical protein
MTSYFVNSGDAVDKSDAAQDCTGADTPEKGHVTKGMTKAYTGVDNFYIKAAACFVFKRFKGSN